MIDIPIKNISKKKFKNFDEKYLYLLKKNKILKSHFYDLTKMLDSIVNLAVSKKFLNVGKKTIKIRYNSC